MTLVPGEGLPSDDRRPVPPGNELRSVLLDLFAAGISGVPIAGGPVAGVAAAYSNRQIRKRIRYLEQLVDRIAQAVERHEVQLGEFNDKVHDLIEHGLNVAGECRTDQEISLCVEIVSATVLALPVRSTHASAHVLLGILNDLEPEHLEALHEMGTVRAINGQVLARPARNGVPDEALVRRLAALGLGDVPESLIARLVAVGLASDVGETEAPSVQSGSSLRRSVVWAPTKLGLRLLEHLEHDAESEPMPPESV